MTLFFTLLPIFLFGNLHCAGMCGPLVAVLAKHPHRWWYFLGRLFAFALMGLVSAEIGMIVFSSLSKRHLSAWLALLCGVCICLFGFSLLLQYRLSLGAWLTKKLSKLSLMLGRLMTSPSASAIFLFGACTILLPCGQTLLVFSLLAVEATPLEGLVNGFLFALLTSPALIAAMQASRFLSKQKKRYHIWMGGAALFAGSLAILRGLADLSVVDHLVLNLSPSSHFHLVLF